MEKVRGSHARVQGNFQGGNGIGRWWNFMGKFGNRGVGKTTVVEETEASALKTGIPQIDAEGRF